jgi:hypothetical protein
MSTLGFDHFVVLNAVVVALRRSKALQAHDVCPQKPFLPCPANVEVDHVDQLCAILIAVPCSQRTEPSGYKHVCSPSLGKGNALCKSLSAAGFGYPARG